VVPPGRRRGVALPAAGGRIVDCAWASVLGFLVSEIVGSMTSLFADTDRVYDAHLRTVMAGMGYDRELIAAVPRAAR